MEPRTLNPQKILYISGNGTFQFTPRKFPHTSGNWNTEKTFHLFSKGSFSYILGNGNPEKKILYFSK